MSNDANNNNLKRPLEDDIVEKTDSITQNPSDLASLPPAPPNEVNGNLLNPFSDNLTQVNPTPSILPCAPPNEVNGNLLNPFSDNLIQVNPHPNRPGLFGGGGNINISLGGGAVPNSGLGLFGGGGNINISFGGGAVPNSGLGLFGGGAVPNSGLGLFGGGAVPNSGLGLFGGSPSQPNPFGGGANQSTRFNNNNNPFIQPPLNQSTEPVGFGDSVINSFKTSYENRRNKISELYLKKISAAIEYEIFQYVYSHLNTEKSVNVFMNIDIAYKNVIKDILNKYKFKLISTPDIITQNITCLPILGYEYILKYSSFSTKMNCVTFIIEL
jgi:hypothetical protein